ncbi:hypothetical protein, partial [Klebsiella pneumoniae]|uniref:hypothetical protein n=1 Tax=Klebsiella pneumoniae TaxID=573 RepID=UPI001C8F34A9
MTIDKFGRSLKSSSQKILQGPKGEGFKLTPEGDFDIKNKRLQNVGDPVDIKDAVNLYYLKDSTPKKLDQSYSVHQYRIQDVAYPQADGNAVNYKCIKEVKDKCIAGAVTTGTLLSN